MMSLAAEPFETAAPEIRRFDIVRQVVFGRPATRMEIVTKPASSAIS